MPKEIMKVHTKGYIQYCKQFKLQLDWKSLAEAGDADKEELCKEISHLLDDINELHKTINDLRKDMDENYSKKRKEEGAVGRAKNSVETNEGLPKRARAYVDRDAEAKAFTDWAKENTVLGDVWKESKRKEREIIEIN